MSMTRSEHRASSARRLALAVAALAVVAPAVAHAGGQPPSPGRSGPTLAGRAVLPVETYAPGPPSGAALDPGGPDHTVNGIRFPTPSQPVEGFSGIVSGRRPGEILAMADNGFGGKGNSQDFLIRAYYLAPHFKTARGGSGTVDVRGYVQFSDPRGVIGFPIVREGTARRVLTGGDIDPESIQRDQRGHYWIGDEFGPWILHFDARGRLLEAPIPMPDGLVSPNNPHLGTGTATVANSRGIEAMAMTPDGRHLVVVLEGAVPGDDAGSRRVYVYDTKTHAFSRRADYRAEAPGNFVADAQALSVNRLLVLERDGGRGENAVFRSVYDVQLAAPGKMTTKRSVVDLAAIPDPNLVSLPPIHAGDVGLGNPFRVACESIEALHVMSSSRLMLGCDNNFPNTGRNPDLADDNEFIVVKVPGL